MMNERMSLGQVAYLQYVMRLSDEEKQKREWWLGLSPEDKKAWELIAGAVVSYARDGIAELVRE